MNRRHAAALPRPPMGGVTLEGVVILGMSIATFTEVHVVVSLMGIVAGWSWWRAC